MGGVFLLLSKISFYGVTLILVILILVLTFKFNRKTESNIVSQTDNEYIASYIDEEYQNEIPGKDDGYIVDKIVCDNGATATWNYDEWGIDIRNATQKIKCSIYFVKGSIFSMFGKTVGSAEVATDDPDSNIRYIGKDPSNYVYFNCSDYSNQDDSTCEKWRIIGVFKNITKADGTKEDLVKIIRDNSIGTYSWDYTSSGSYTNNWDTSTLQQLLNSGAYYNSTKGMYYNMSTTASVVDFTTTGLKNVETKNKIETVIWTLGGTSTYDSSSNGLASHWYGYERGTTVYSGRPTTWTGKIGLMYSSDYGYSTAGGTITNRKNCLNKVLSSWHLSENEDCKNNSYLYKADYNQWLLPPGSIYPGHAFIMYSDGGVNWNQTMNNYHIRPTLYLKSNISILQGDGSSTNPYQLKIS